VAGWIGHAREQTAMGRLIRPASQYIGATGRAWSPLDERNQNSGSVAAHAR
jgi:citrate synthase